MNSLNLARKWRPERFDDMVGQGIALRMIKNSLYRGHYFPVYLFSGQRGCGKTTAARIFAAAINCARLDAFKENPTESIPCTECKSCLAMRRGDHPDFVEVDAASHTGVDNVRQLIESSAFLPVMGAKKVYLIDEVHMLSKAACNALLKVLEEPPSTALFILATTDPQKMLETIRSRCFQLFFMAIPGTVLVDYLEQICQKEQILYERSGLEAIAQESDRCVRDAINLLEQARFAADTVTYDLVISLLGHVSDQYMLQLVEIVFKKDIVALIELIPLMLFSTASVEYVWKRLIELLRGLIWLKNGVVPSHITLPAQLPIVAHPILLTQVHECLAFLYQQYDMHAKGMFSGAWLEIALLQWCTQNDNGSHFGSTPESLGVQKGKKEELSVQQAKRVQKFDNHAEKAVLAIKDTPDSHSSFEQKSEEKKDAKTFSQEWRECMQKIIASDNRLIVSLLGQVQKVEFVETIKELRLIFDKEKSFFQDLLQQTAHEWQPIVESVYGEKIAIVYLFEHMSGASSKKETKALLAEHKHVEVSKETKNGDSFLHASEKKVVMRQGYPSVKKKESVYRIPKGEVVDISDRSQWPVASMITDYFPGTVAILKEDDHGIS